MMCKLTVNKTCACDNLGTRYILDNAGQDSGKSNLFSLTVRQWRHLIVAAFLTAVLAGPISAADAVETALVGPGTLRINGFGDIPGVLLPSDVEHYQRIFDLQADGNWQAAQREIDRLQNPVLLGHVLAQKYLHPTKYRSKFKELKDWMAAYAGHPQARRLHWLAKQRMAKNARAPRAPVAFAAIPVAWSDDRATPVPVETKPLSSAQRRQARRMMSEVRRRVNRGWPTGALKVLADPKAARLLTTTEFDEARRTIAKGYFIAGKDEEALATADRAIVSSGDAVPLAAWWGGLAAWRLGRYDEAMRHFGALALSQTASDWNVAAGAYWAARSALVSRRPEEVNRFLEIGVERPLTFYGVLSRRALGLRPNYNWTLPYLDPVEIGAVIAEPIGARAIALLQVGQPEEAEAELRNLAGLRPALIPAITALATRMQLPALSLKLAALGAGSGATTATLFPLPHWEPDGGFAVEPALIFAFMRQESSFNVRAKSPAGARGLMQLMPRTASFIGHERGLRGSTKYKLFDPEFNIALGQRYIKLLLNNRNVSGDLFRLAMAYNAGPGSLQKWVRKVRFEDDPLLFIESIPARETRIFIERVLTNYWIYRDRLGQDTPTLDAVAAGGRPTYEEAAAHVGDGLFRTDARN